MTETTVIEVIAYDCGFRAGQAYAAGLLAALEKMTFAYEHRSTLPPEYKVAAFNEARAAIAAAKGADQ
jgi:hypothetical protein